MLRICALSVHFYNGSVSFTLSEKSMFLKFKKYQCLGLFRPHLGALFFFPGNVKRCIAKQNGCCGSLGTKDQWSKIVTNCLHPHDVALICDRNHSHASWTTARHEKTFSDGQQAATHTRSRCVPHSSVPSPRLFLEWEGTCQDHDRGP